jgi:hypothetical protein
MLIDEIIFELKQAKKSIAKRDTAESDERLPVAVGGRVCFLTEFGCYCVRISF